MKWADDFTSEQKIQLTNALQSVKDPEIDSISIIELGMVDRVERNAQELMIYMLPTFMGCPALDIIKSNVLKAVSELVWIERAMVSFIYDPPWTSERVTEVGRAQLKTFGIAPPPKHFSESGEWHVQCPYCDSTYTAIDNLFGPTACRSILYCKSCKNPFEAMKPVSTMM